MEIEIEKISDKYVVKRIKNHDILDVYQLCKGNPAYYVYTQSELTIESIEDDLKALPPNKGYEDKFYLGFYREDELVAIMDLIMAYPNEETAYIGLFMMNKDFQGKGVGTEIINDVILFLKKQGFSYVKLGCIKENKEGKNFWLKNMFLPTGAEIEMDDYIVVSMQREL